MAKAVWNGILLAESNWCVTVDGNSYFPADSVRWEYFKPSISHPTNTWIGRATFYNITVDGKVNRDAAWHYPAPCDGAQQIKEHVAFWKGVKIVK